MKKTLGNESEGENEFDVDEPEEVEENNSNDANDGGEDDKGARRSTRLRTTPKKKMKYTNSSDEDEPEDEEEDFDEDDDEEEEYEAATRKKSSGGRKPRVVKPKKKKKQQSEDDDDEKDDDDDDDDDDEDDDSSNDASGAADANPADKEYTSGAFLVSKTDLAEKDKDPPLWRIDGKALLQKYIPFKDDDGKTLYRNTFTFSGWSINNKNNFHPATVVFKQQSQKEHIVEFKRDLLPKEEEVDE